ncbi:MAG: type II toxin-antitoxin system prevent-host-death family antitoxin [Bifidobacteriaceae bacterium]|jgi:prevent-host-death family protein|nr:type II toxin-antitoxin system prevent-host-death family antitoxin [Bifidobacteriaceae bacterium]
MKRVGIRELRQNPAAAIAAARAGEVVVITDRGTEVAQLTPLPGGWRERLVAAGGLLPGALPPSRVPPPLPAGDGKPLSAVLADLRRDER